MPDIQVIARIQPPDEQRQGKDVLIPVIERNHQLRGEVCDGLGCAPERLTLTALYIHFDDGRRSALEDAVHRACVDLLSKSGDSGLPSCLGGKRHRGIQTPCHSVIRIDIVHAVQILAQFLEVFPVRFYRIDPDILATGVLENLFDGVSVIRSQIHIHLVGCEPDDLAVNLRFRRGHVHQIADIAADAEVDDVGIHPA